MTKIEIKKALYKEKPEAFLQHIRMGNAYYTASLAQGEMVNFCVPVEEMGDTDFFTTMDAKLLQRWIDVEE
jgi:hypothetical protein